MKLKIIALLLITSWSLSAQNYFEGKRLYCETQNPKAKELFELGIKALYLNTSLDEDYLRKTSDVFLRAFQTDSTFCDAIFFSAYTRRLINDKDAFVLYYVADSLAQHRAIEFKSNLAAEALRIGTPKAVDLARKKYREMIQYFPESPEGYYGMGVVAPFFESYDEGIANLNIAAQKYTEQGKPVGEDLTMLKGVLLAMKGVTSDALLFLDMVESNYKNNDSFCIYYSYCLFKESEKNSDKKLFKKGVKYYFKIRDKNRIPEHIKSQLPDLSNE